MGARSSRNSPARVNPGAPWAARCSPGRGRIGRSQPTARASHLAHRTPAGSRPSAGSPAAVLQATIVHDTKEVLMPRSNGSKTTTRRRLLAGSAAGVAVVAVDAVMPATANAADGDNLKIGQE